MKVRKVIRKPVDVDENGVRVAGGVNAVVSANVNEGGRNSVSSKQSIRVTQRNGETVVEERTESSGDVDDAS